MKEETRKIVGRLPELEQKNQTAFLGLVFNTDANEFVCAYSIRGAVDILNEQFGEVGAVDELYENLMPNSEAIFIHDLERLG